MFVLQTWNWHFLQMQNLQENKPNKSNISFVRPAVINVKPLSSKSEQIFITCGLSLSFVQTSLRRASFWAFEIRSNVTKSSAKPLLYNDL